MQAQAFAVVVQPGPQPRPFTQERLVGDLDRLLPRGRITIERQQSCRAASIDHNTRVSIVAKLGALHPATRVLGPFAERDEPREQSPDSILLATGFLRVQLLGALREGTGQTP